MILQEEYNLNLESQLSKKYVKVSQYDTGRRLLITLLKNDCSMFKIPSEASASINGLKPDGKGFRYDCSIENNKVVVDMKEQMTVLAGYVKCEILLSKGGERIATANFMLSVEESPLSENTPISSTDIPLLQKAIEASEIVLSVEKTVKGYSESASKSSQSAQESAESASNASASSAESARNSSQSAQASAESANNASQSATNAQESAESASNSAREAKTSAESAIQTKAEVEQLKKETVEQTKTLTESAKQEISTVKDATVSEVTQFKNDTISDITSIKEGMVEEVTVIKNDAKAEADKAKESETNAKLSETNASNSAKEAKASADSVATVTSDVEKLKEDLPNKITKFYASNQGETHITDSDNGKIQDMMIYGKFSRDGTASPENPVEIKSVVNPIVKACGANIIQINDIQEYTSSQYGFTLSIKDGLLKVKGIILENCTIRTNANGIIPFIEPLMLQSGKTYIYNPNPIKGTEREDCYLDFTNSNTLGFSFINRNINKPKKLTDLEAKYSFSFNLILHKGAVIDMEWKPQVLLNEYLLPYEPYKEQSIQLPITLNAIPVSSNGNVTIDGQQYIADRVVEKDGVFGIERNIREIHTNTKTMNNSEEYPGWNKVKGISDTVYYNEVTIGTSRKLFSACNFTENAIFQNNINKNNILYYLQSNIGYSQSELIAKAIEADMYIRLQDAIFEPLPVDIQVKLQALVTNYPVTNISVTSDQLDGYAVFNYPISLANGWNYVKQQLNDNRDYIYDMDLQSAEAYVNSEYAVTLTELEV